MSVLAIALGGALGSVLRYLLGNAVQSSVGRQFPFGTLAVNVIGCLLIGLVYVWLLERGSAGVTARAFWMVGVLGGFTTFSSFSLETFDLAAQAAYGRALLNVVFSVVLCVSATWVGVLVGRQL